MTSLITPALGLVFWTLFIFLLLLVLLRKYAWKPILTSVKERNTSISTSLEAAKDAREELLSIEDEKAHIILLAQREKDKLIKEGKRLQETFIKDAKQKAELEAERIISAAKLQLEQERINMVDSLKKEVAILAVDIASDILKKELAFKDEHQKFIQEALKEVHFN